MKFYISYLKDILGNNYLGISIPNDIVVPYLEGLKTMIPSEYDLLLENKFNRDGDSYHITVLNVRDYNILLSEGVDFTDIFNTEIDDINMKGIGVASKNGNISYFVVCESEKLNFIRDKFNLRKHDFHITLGFDKKEVFGVRKNLVYKEIK